MDVGESGMVHPLEYDLPEIKEREMNAMIAAHKETLVKLLVALFLSASLLIAAVGPADAAVRSKCRTNPENFSFYHGKCLSDKRIEILKERANHQNED